MRHCSLCLFLSLLLLAVSSAPTAAEDRQLKPFEPVWGRLAGGQSHFYRIGLSSGQYLEAAVDQHGIDVVVELSGSAGEKLATFDTRRHGREVVLWVARGLGSHRLEVRARHRTAAPGRYRLKIAALREATPRDRSRAEAARLLQEGEQLRAPRVASGVQQAIEKYHQALSLWEAAADRQGEALTLYHLGLAYDDLAEMQKSLEAQSRAVSLWRELGDHQGEGTSRGALAAVYRQLGENLKAHEQAHRALALSHAVADRDGQADALTILGLLKSPTHWGEILRLLERALSLYRINGSRGEEASTLTRIAMYEYYLGGKEGAFETLARAVRLYREVDDRRGEAQALQNLAYLRRYSGDYQRSWDYCLKALPLRVATGDRSGEASTQIAAAEAAFRLGNLEEAQRRAESAIGIAESVRAGIEDLRLRTFYFALKSNYYHHYINVLLSLHRVRPSDRLLAAAFEASERDRARSLLDRLEQSNGSGLVALSLAEAQNLLDDDTLLLSYWLTPPYVWAVSRHSLAGFELPQQVTIETWPRGTDPAELRVRQQVTQVTIEAAARSFHRLLTAEKNLGGSSVPVDRLLADIGELPRYPRESTLPRQAAALSEMILGPVAELLRGKKRLVIASDAALQCIPFGALPVPGDRDGRPMLATHEIVHLPSASVLAALRRRTEGRKQADRLLAVVADPVFDIDDVRLQRPDAQRRPKRNISSAATRLGVARLPFSRREAEEIVKLAPPGTAMQALDFAATRATVTGPEMRRYRIVHFATHGVVSAEDPDLSGMVLSLVDERGKSQDGLLRLGEIYNLDLPAELVVLSGCRTGLGKDVAGEGPLTLARGFMSAGAPRVVVSLWQVDDEATAELMRLFYQGMLGPRQLRPAAALREAQLALSRQKRWEAPYYWAGFVLNGDWR